jgi:glycosyltransferase involved in cell wall biosynthesis
MSDFPKVIFLFMGTDWEIYSRRTWVKALADATAHHKSTLIAVNRPLCPVTTLFKKPHRANELFGQEKLEQVGDNLYLFSPRYVLHDHLAHRLLLIEKLNIASLRKSCRQLQKRLGISESHPIVWFNYPQQGYVSELFESSFKVFELYDNLTDFSGKPNLTSLTLEKELRRNVDLMVTTSQKLQAEFASHYRVQYLVGNGLSRETFEQLGASDVKSMPEITAVPSPRLGFAGEISARLDWPLLLKLARTKPEWNFVFVGRTPYGTAARNIRDTVNMYHFGPYQHSEMPAVWKSFDSGIMPYYDTEFFRFSNPLKFYEMAAAGLPSVSSPMEELNQHPDTIVRVVPNNADAWINALDSTLKLDRIETTKVGREIAGRFIWEEMAQRLLQHVATLYYQHYS